jgi:sterol desaturase/sphingolipid hydroxylase (fatty acid hydroxylase superfamily)
MTELDSLRESMLFALSTPLYLVVIGAEILFSNLRDRNFYSVKGTFTNIYLMLMNMGIDLLLRGVSLVVLNHFFVITPVRIENVILYWTVLLLAQDFMFYILHVVDHYCRLFWAVHVTHHSSEEFNLTVGFRSSVLQPLYRFLYFIPLALIGFNGVDIIFMYSATQIYGILVHTQAVGKLGFLEWFLVTPSHHRVHHASNPLYLDRNMGMVFIIWDRIFGTFQEEVSGEQAKYGLTKSKEFNGPAETIFHEFKDLVKDVCQKGISWRSRWMYIFGPPGWSHDGSRKTARELREEISK